MVVVAAIIKRIVTQLKATPEGDGTMFDNTMIMYFPENGETHHGVGTEAPFLIMSGANCNLDIAGRYIRYPEYGKPGHRTIGNWWTTWLNAFGNPVEHYGNLDLNLQKNGIQQSGALGELMA